MTETVNINSISKDDLPWIIEYESDKCRLCGRCIAACSFGAIKAAVQKRKKVQAVSDENGFQIDENQKAIPVIRQVIDAEHFCRGCGISLKSAQTAQLNLSETIQKFSERDTGQKLPNRLNEAEEAIFTTAKELLIKLK